ncbi:hypothetical protein BASA81_002312 [Batrachochytrium salamandrivorans]|nr:hypothetical protein BASA81_002312 [Batrachochytrium salamandrivorans]
MPHIGVLVLLGLLAREGLSVQVCSKYEWWPSLAQELVPQSPCSDFSSAKSCRQDNYCCFEHGQCLPSNPVFLECANMRTSEDCSDLYCAWDDIQSLYDLGYGDVTYIRPSPYYSTPNIDAMAASPHAMRMDRFHSPGTSCSPSRAAMMTGRSPMRNCVWGANTEYDKPNVVFRPNYPVKDVLDNTLGRVAQDNGYKTFFAGKWHISRVDEVGPKYGFDEYLVTGGNMPTFDSTCFCESNTAQCYAGHYTDKNRLSPNYGCTIQSSPNLALIKSLNRTSADLFVTALETFLDTKLQPEEAFFAIVSFNEPHLPFIAPPWVKNQLLKTTGLEKLGAKTAALAADYYGAIQAMDSAVGRARNALARTGRAQDTLVIFTSDNGPEVVRWDNLAINGYGSTGGLRGEKRSIYEGGHRVPAVLEWPRRISQNQINDQVLSLLDVSATIFELMLADQPDRFASLVLDGKPIREFTSKWNRQAPLFICTSVENNRPLPCQQLAAIRDDFKLVLTINAQGGIVAGKTEFYDYVESEYTTLPMNTSAYFNLMQAAQNWSSTIILPSLEFCNSNK